MASSSPADSSRYESFALDETRDERPGISRLAMWSLLGECKLYGYCKVVSISMVIWVQACEQCALYLKMRTDIYAGHVGGFMRI